MRNPLRLLGSAIPKSFNGFIRTPTYIPGHDAPGPIVSTSTSPPAPFGSDEFQSPLPAPGKRR